MNRKPIDHKEPTKLVLVALSLLCFGFAYHNWWLYSNSIDVSPRKIARQDGQAEVNSRADEFSFKLPPIRTYVQTQSRPLFSSTRRPFQKKVVKAQAPRIHKSRTTSNKLRLLGIVITAGVRNALIASQPKPEGEWAEIGTSIEGWHVKSIYADHAVIAKGNKRQKIMLYKPQ